MDFKRNKITVVFDLDDTLYSEMDYVTSGKIALGQEIARLYGIDIMDALAQCGSDFIGFIREQLRLPAEATESLLWMYRLHRPTLILRAEIADLLSTLKFNNMQLCILTDGRSVTQRLKVKALGLSHLQMYISEEIGEGKPSQKGFLKIEQDFPADIFVYVGDNLAKDFLAPNTLGWITCHLDPGPMAIHHQPPADDVAAPYLPRLFAGRIETLQSFLLSL